MKQKTVLITGATGFFGSIACDYFEKNNWQVIKAGRKEKKVDLCFDLDKPDEFSAIELNKAVNLFIHAAAAHEVACLKSPYPSISQNVIGTKAALDFCVKHHIKQFVYLSTFHVFGVLEGEMNEDTIPRPLNDYGLSHLLAEQYVQLYQRQGKINGLIVRPTNFIDLPVEIKDFNRWTLTPYAFCKEAMINGKIILKTPGNQKRNFVSVNEICYVIEKAIEKDFTDKVIHVYGPDSLSIRELALLVKEIAYEIKQVEVAVEVPEGDNESPFYEYRSKYINQIYSPVSKVNRFIRSMIEMMECNNMGELNHQKVELDLKAGINKLIKCNKIPTGGGGGK